MHHGTTTKNNTNANKNAGYNGRSGMKIIKGIQNDACKWKQKINVTYYWHMINCCIILPVKNMGIDIKNPPTAHVRLTLDFSKYLLSLPSKFGDLTSLTANRNCMAHTSKQHRFRDNDKAHNAKVTS